MGNACTKGNDEDIGMSQKQGTGASTAVGQSIDDQILGGMPGDSLKQKVGLTFSCFGLPNMDKGSKTDPFVVLWQMNGKQKQMIGKTELIMDNLNPEFVTEIGMDYQFESQQVMLAEVYDCDDANTINNLQKQEFVGSYEFQLGKAVSSRNQQLTNDLKMKNGKNAGKITISLSEKKADYGKNVASFQVEASGQKLQQICFMVINKQNKSGQWKPVYKSATTGNIGSGYKFNNITIDTDTLADDDNNKPVQIQLYKHNPNGNHLKLGVGVFTLTNMIDSGGSHTVQIPGCGKAVITQFKIEDRVTFLDYIFGGCEVGVHVAVDYTLSNMEYSKPSSLHYLNPQTNMNGYTDAIHSCLSILQNYDADKQFPMYGFGGKLPGDTKVSHCFALNGNIYNPEVPGIDGALNAYYQSRGKVQLYGGTEFSSIMKYVNGFANQEAMEMTQFNQKYTILLILTDGVIGDLQQTIDEVVKASSLPLSIIIVGIGGADFEQMEQLDGDEAPLYSQTMRQYASRDIVQFVPFRDVKNDPTRLTKMVLNEVPRQLTSYFASMNIKPNPPRVDSSAIQNAMQAKLGGMMGKAQETYFWNKKNQMMTQLQQRGWDPILVANFLDQIGVANEDENKVDAAMRNQGYVNPMTMR